MTPPDHHLDHCLYIHHHHHCGVTTAPPLSRSVALNCRLDFQHGLAFAGHYRVRGCFFNTKLRYLLKGDAEVTCPRCFLLEDYAAYSSSAKRR
ncbi:hypothetical protein L1887_22812 [Cichorium endivia]|nr:hypothetical protein L1887_22812 [Cichorium endivia]